MRRMLFGERRRGQSVRDFHDLGEAATSQQEGRQQQLSS